MSGSSKSNNKINAVFYAESYHPIQAGSIDGTDILPHDHAVYRALLCSSAKLYDPFKDPKVIGHPYCTIFVGRLSRLTTEDTLRKAMSKYGRVKDLRLVRDIVTGASRGYAFVEYETEREMRRAYMEAHHTVIDDSEIIVDYNRQQLMPGWIPRRLGGGLGGKKESGQLRFGGRERPFRAPLRPIPHDELKRLGIPPPPEGRYMSRHQIPSPPRRRNSSVDHDHGSHKRYTEELSHRRSSSDRGEHSYRRRSIDHKEDAHKSNFTEGAERNHRGVCITRENITSCGSSADREGSPENRTHLEGEYYHQKERTRRRDSVSREERSHRRDSRSRDKYSHRRSSPDQDDRSYVHRKHSSSKSHTHKRRKHSSPDHFPAD